MAYSFKNSKGKEYFLHVKKVKRASGKETELFYFATDIRKGQEGDKVPAGKEVVELASGLPVLKKK
jgi:trehalose-6-phosphatase